MAHALRYTTVNLGPIGDLYVVYSAEGIALLTPVGGDLDAQVHRRLGKGVVRDDSQRDRFHGLLSAWLGGGDAPAPIDFATLTPFERQVLGVLATIERGQVRPYAWLAARVGKPGASRAVGNVMARNPVPLLLPCHRVVAASGLIGNYSMGGPEVKRRLLQIEGVDVEAVEGLANQGFRFVGAPDSQTFCYPTCRSQRPVSPVPLRSAAEATAAGYKPCPHCLPV